jgi:hypothetical protein
VISISRVAEQAVTGVEVHCAVFRFVARCLARLFAYVLMAVARTLLNCVH